jgi:hypothetical protein
MLIAAGGANVNGCALEGSMHLGAPNIQCEAHAYKYLFDDGIYIFISQHGLEGFTQYSMAAVALSEAMAHGEPNILASCRSTAPTDFQFSERDVSELWKDCAEEEPRYTLTSVQAQSCVLPGAINYHVLFFS